MRIISRKALREFWDRHADSEEALKAWYAEAKSAEWESPADVKKRYPSSSIIPNDRLVFNIKGNTYRLIVAVRYDLGILFVRFVGTHADYDKVDASTI